MCTLILASSSKYRHQLLKNAGYIFEFQSPDIDETSEPNETPSELVIRLATSKATCIAHKRSASDFILGLDQVLVFDNEIYGKPKSEKEAIDNFMRFKNQKATLLCAVALAHKGAITFEKSIVVLKFGTYSEDEITRYLKLEQPYDCAAGLKTETRGALLLEKISSDDPTSIIGMPILTINRMLHAANFPNMPLS